MVTAVQGAGTGAKSRYTAFVSYNRGIDGELSEALQSALQSVGRPWYRRRALRVFRDVNVLAVSPDAGGGVQRGLDDSEFLILLASPQAAGSEWVNREVAHWLATKPRENILIALTAGEVFWDKKRGDFDWARTTALPGLLAGVFAAEPSWIDLRPTRGYPHKSRSRAWRVAVAPLAAALHHTTVDEILRDDERVFRRNRLTAIAAVAALSTLTAAAVGFAVEANRQARIADERTVTAIALQLAAKSENLGDADPATAGLLAVAARQLLSTGQTQQAVDAALLRRGRQLLVGHTDVITDLAFSPDGSTVATSSADGTARIWDVASGTSLRTLVHNGEVNAVAFSPDSSIVATASYDSTARLWDMASGKETFSTAWADMTDVAISPDGRVLAIAGWSVSTLVDVATGQERQLPANAAWIDEVAFSPDGAFVVTRGFNGDTEVWQVGTGEMRVRIEDDHDIAAVAFSPNSRNLIAAGTEVAVWDLATGTRGPYLLTGGGTVTDLAYSPDGRTLAIASDDGTIQLFNTDATTPWQPFGTLDGHNGAALSVAFSPDGLVLATGGADGDTRLWDAANYESIATLAGHNGAVRNLAFSPDSTTLATASDDGTARLWAAAIDDPVKHSNSGQPVTLVAYSPRGDVIASASGADVELLNAISGETMVTLAEPEGVTALAFSPDGTTLATASGDQAVLLWDVATGRLRETLTGHTDPTAGLVFSPDGTTLATASGDQTVLLWDVATGRPRKTLTGHTDAVTALAFGPDSDTVATTSRDRTARLWNARTGQLIAALTGNSSDLRSVRFSPDGRAIATAGGAFNTARLWDVRTGRPLATLTGHSGAVTDVAFSPDGAIVATASRDRTARLWDAATGALVTTLSGHTRGLVTVVYSPSGNVLATVSDDGAVRFWTSTGRPIPTPATTVTDERAMAFSPDGTTFATGDATGHTQVWQSPISGDPTATLCARIGRQMTEQEWAEHVSFLPFQEVCPTN